MRKLIYKKSGKALLILLQALAAGVIAVCLATVNFWLEGSLSFQELSRGYEESELFFRQVDTILGHKINGQDNDALFETGGEFNRDIQIDIQSYGGTGTAVMDLNTTYLLGDLLDYYENGGWEALHTAIRTALGNQGSREPGEQLDEQAELLETITPVTGITLAECSRWYSDSAGFVLEMYTELEQVCAEIYDRYLVYTTEQDESWSSEAPSNLLYCIENTSTGELYTNIDADSYDAAVAAAEQEEDFVSLYEGERSFNIMVTNPDRVLNAAAAEWFLSERFVGSNERCYLAVNTAYPVSDELHTFAEYYARRENIVWGSVIAAALGLIVLLTCFTWSLRVAGLNRPAQAPSEAILLPVDSIPTELWAGICLIIIILYILLASGWTRVSDSLPGQENYLLAIAATSAWLFFLSAAMSFLRRFRAGTLWTNSVSRIVIQTWRRVSSSRAAAGQLIFLYLAFFVLNFLFLLLFNRVGLVLVAVLDMAVLLYLMRDMAGKQNIYEGIHQISRGDLQYRIDVSALQGEPLELAKAVNEMGESLSEAVEAIVKNERLKAELITNVSHDLKTPLTSIVNYVDLLKRENLQGERVQQYLEVLDQKSQRLKQLTEDLVEASKISSGNIELDMARLQLQSMLLQAAGEFEERFEEHALTLVWDMEKEPAFILADGRQLWRILENLLGNICKYAKEGTEVRLTMRRENQEVMFSLRNISRDEITVEADELTGRFVRGDRSRSTEGSGLGLSIAQNLTELLGGRFELCTEKDSFEARVYFPLADGNNAGKSRGMDKA